MVPPSSHQPSCLSARLGSLSLPGLYLSSREHRTRDSSHVSSTNNTQGELLLVRTCVCAHTQRQCAWQVCQTLSISISSFGLESKAAMGQMQTTPTERETLTDILIDFNTDFTCRLVLLLCTLSRHASLSCKLRNTGKACTALQRLLNLSDKYMSRQNS